MSDIIVTLHPEGNKNDDLYPNIKPQNIPDGSITEDKLAYSNFEDIINAWLDNHPEATTTVEDYSLTIKKLVKGTIGYVTPELYGAVGDGVTDDTQAIQDAINSGFPVMFEKTYSCSSGIYLGQRNIYFYGGGTIIFNKNTFTNDYNKWLFRNFDANTSNALQRYVIVENLKFEGLDSVNAVVTNTTTFGVCFQLQCIENVIFNNCSFKNFYGTPIQCNGCTTVKINNCNVDNVGSSHNYTNTTNFVTISNNYYDQGTSQTVQKRVELCSITNNNCKNIRDEFVRIESINAFINNNVVSNIGQYFLEIIKDTSETNIIKNYFVFNNNIDKLATYFLRLDTLDDQTVKSYVNVYIFNNIINEHGYAYNTHHVETDSNAHPELIFISGKSCLNFTLQNNIINVNNNYTPYSGNLTYFYLNGVINANISGNNITYENYSKRYMYYVTTTAICNDIVFENNKISKNSSMVTHVTNYLIVSPATNTKINNNIIDVEVDRAICNSYSSCKTLQINNNLVLTCYDVLEQGANSQLEYLIFIGNYIKAVTYPFQSAQSQKTTKLLQGNNYFEDKTNVSYSKFFSEMVSNTWV